MRAALILCLFAAGCAEQSATRNAAYSPTTTPAPAPAPKETKPPTLAVPSTPKTNVGTFDLTKVKVGQVGKLPPNWRYKVLTVINDQQLYVIAHPPDYPIPRPDAFSFYAEGISTKAIVNFATLGDDFLSRTFHVSRISTSKGWHTQHVFTAVP